MISEAEAFVRHNTHDCLARTMRKTIACLPLSLWGGRGLVVFLVSSKGHLEVDLLRGAAAFTHLPLACGWATYLEHGEGFGTMILTL